MNIGFVELRDLGSLDHFLELSNRTPVVIFKHSETCGISDRAYRELLKLAEGKAKFSNDGEDIEIPMAIVTVQTAREVSNEIEIRTGIDHESPQVLIIANSKVAWTASHGGVRAEAIENAVGEAVGSKQIEVISLDGKIKSISTRGD